MGWLITLGVSFAGAVAAMAICGMFLPRDHVASGSAEFPSAPEALFLLAVTLQEESDVKTRVTEEARPHKRITEIIEEPGAAFGGTWTLEFQPLTEGGTRLTITERGRVYNPLFRFLSRFAFGHHATINSFLNTLGSRDRESREG